MIIEKDLYEKIKEKTLTYYDEFKVPDKEQYYIESENINVMLEDLLNKINILEEEIEDIKQDIEDNYRPIPYSEQVEISDRDFI